MDRAMALQVVRERLTTPTGWAMLAAAAEFLAADVERLQAELTLAIEIVEDKRNGGHRLQFDGATSGSCRFFIDGTSRGWSIGQAIHSEIEERNRAAIAASKAAETPEPPLLPDSCELPEASDDEPGGLMACNPKLLDDIF